MHDYKGIHEQYLVLVAEIETMKMSYVIVPNRRQFAKMLNMMSSEKYAVISIQLISNLKYFSEFIIELKNEDKPDGLYFGDE